MDGIDQADGQQPAQKVKITSKELASKFSTKREVYLFLRSTARPTCLITAL